MMKSGQGPFRNMGYQTLTVSTTAQALTLPTSSSGKGQKPRYALMRVETNPVRFRDDGTDPTATEGILLAATDIQPFWYCGDLSMFRVIRQGGADATLKVLFYR